MDRFRNLPEPPADAPPLIFHILPETEEYEEPIGPGDLEIEFEFDPEPDANDE